MASLTSLYDEMNTFLADQIVLGMKIHNFHWFITGDGFFPIHEKLDEYYGYSEKRIDEVAEKLLTIGSKPLGSLKDVLERSSIEELDNEWMSAKEGFEALVVDFEHMRNLATHIIKVAEGVEDYATADYFTDVVDNLGIDIWQFKAYLR